MNIIILPILPLISSIPHFALSFAFLPFVFFFTYTYQFLTHTGSLLLFFMFSLFFLFSHLFYISSYYLLLSFPFILRLFFLMFYYSTFVSLNLLLVFTSRPSQSHFAQCRTHLAGSFRCSKYSRKMFKYLFIDMPTASALSCLVGRQSSKFILWILST